MESDLIRISPMTSIQDVLKALGEHCEEKRDSLEINDRALDPVCLTNRLLPHIALSPVQRLVVTRRYPTAIFSSRSFQLCFPDVESFFRAWKAVSPSHQIFNLGMRIILVSSSPQSYVYRHHITFTKGDTLTSWGSLEPSQETFNQLWNLITLFQLDYPIELVSFRGKSSNRRAVVYSDGSVEYVVQPSSTSKLMNS